MVWVLGVVCICVSFCRALHPAVEKHQRIIISLFIISSTVIFVMMGNPVNLLMLAGGINGLILPVALVVILVAAVKSRIVGNYKHPVWMQVAGWITALVMH